MSLGVLGALLEGSPEFLRLTSALGRSRFGSRLQVLSEAAPFALAQVHRVFEAPILVVAPRPEDARRLYEQVLLWAGGDSTVLHFPETETLPFERLVPDVDTSQHRIRTLWALAQERTQPPMVIASAAAIAQKTIGRDALEDSVQALERGQRIDLEETIDSWRRMGYRVEPTVDVPGLVGRRGGIVDIYPIASEAPARLELWGDEIDSIRHFDQETQRSTDMVDSVTVIPARETLPGLVGPRAARPDAGRNRHVRMRSRDPGPDIRRNRHAPGGRGDRGSRLLRRLLQHRLVVSTTSPKTPCL